jgi:hypothetical protein
MKDLDIRTIGERVADDNLADKVYRDGMLAFENSAISAGYCVDSYGYWKMQYREYMRGNRGPDMHDFTLAELSR